jgi:hypothetical protein
MKTKTRLAGAMGLALAAVFAALPDTARSAGSACATALLASNGERSITDLRATEAKLNGIVSPEEYIKLHESLCDCMASWKLVAMTTDQRQEILAKQSPARVDDNSELK